MARPLNPFSHKSLPGLSEEQKAELARKDTERAKAGVSQRERKKAGEAEHNTLLAGVQTQHLLGDNPDITSVPQPQALGPEGVTQDIFTTEIRRQAQIDAVKRSGGDPQKASDIFLSRFEGGSLSEKISTESRFDNAPELKELFSSPALAGTGIVNKSFSDLATETFASTPTKEQQKRGPRSRQNIQLTGRSSTILTSPGGVLNGSILSGG